MASDPLDVAKTVVWAFVSLSGMVSVAFTTWKFIADRGAKSAQLDDKITELDNRKASHAEVATVREQLLLEVRERGEKNRVENLDTWKQVVGLDNSLKAAWRELEALRSAQVTFSAKLDENTAVTLEIRGMMRGLVGQPQPGKEGLP